MMDVAAFVVFSAVFGVGFLGEILPQLGEGLDGERPIQAKKAPGAFPVARKDDSICVLNWCRQAGRERLQYLLQCGITVRLENNMLHTEVPAQLLLNFPHPGPHHNLYAA